VACLGERPPYHRAAETSADYAIPHQPVTHLQIARAQPVTQGPSAELAQPLPVTSNGRRVPRTGQRLAGRADLDDRCST
jgi:hypothetical protein